MGTRCLTDPVILHLWNEAAGRAATAFCGLWGRGGQARAPAPSPELPLGLASASCSHPFWDHLPLTLLCLAGLPAVPITPS